jgi:hypothetical protein
MWHSTGYGLLWCSIGSSKIAVEEGFVMFESRRKLLRTLWGAAGILAAGRWAYGAAQTPQPMASPNAPTNQNVPAGMNGPDLIKPDKPAANPVIQEQIAASVQQLFKLATELKEEVEHTNLNATFSIAFVKKAQQIEKLARQIKDRAKG